jgi:hypothetical protein
MDDATRSRDRPMLGGDHDDHDRRPSPKRRAETWRRPVSETILESQGIGDVWSCLHGQEQGLSRGRKSPIC